MDGKQISELRNLDPACERDLNAVGIYTLGDIKVLGFEENFLQMMKGRIKRAQTHKKGKTKSAPIPSCTVRSTRSMAMRPVVEELGMNYGCIPPLSPAACARQQLCGLVFRRSCSAPPSTL
jgi:hypothetical protein